MLQKYNESWIEDYRGYERYLILQDSEPQMFGKPVTIYEDEKIVRIR